MAFPTTGLLDSCARADGPIGSNWTKGIYATTDSGFTITSNAVLSDGAGSRANAHMFWNPSTFGADSEATLDVVSASGIVVGLWGRLTGTTGAMNGYAWKRDIGGAVNEMSRYDGGAQTVLGVSTNGSGFAAGDSWGLEIIGNAIKVYRKPSGGSWALESGTSRTDSTYSAAGNVGAEEWGSGTSFRNFGGGTVVTAAAITAAPPRPLLMRLRPFSGIGLPIRVSPVAPPAGAAALQVTAAGQIATGEAFGTTVVQRQVREDGTGIASAAAVGNPAVQRQVREDGTGISSGVAFGTTAVRRLLGNPGQIASGQAFGVTKLFMQLGPAGVQSAAAFGVARLSRLLGAVGIATGEQFGVTQVERLVGNVGQIASQAAVGIARLIRVATAGQISSGEAFGTEKVLRQVREDGTGVASAVAFGTATIGATPAVSVTGAGAISTGQQFGTTRLQRQVREDGTGIASTAAEGQPAAGRRIGAAGIGSGEAFGQATVGRRVGATGVATGQAFGTQTVGRQVGAAGISTGQAFGTAKLSRQVGAAGIPSGESFGTPRTIRVTQLGAIQSATAFGTTVIGHPTLPPAATLQPGLYASARQPRLRSSTSSPVIAITEVVVCRVRVSTAAPAADADTSAPLVRASDDAL